MNFVKQKLQQFKNSPFFILYLAIFITSLGFGIIFPLLPLYAKTFQASETVIGILAASFAVAQFFFSPLWGRLSDKYGRKPIIALALLGSSFSYISFGLAENLTFLFVSRFFQGIFAAALLPSAQAYIADATSKEERTAAMGKLGAMLALGFIFGPAFGGVLNRDSFALPFFIAGGIALLNFFFVIFWLPKVVPLKIKKQISKVRFFDFRPVWKNLKSALLPYFIMIGLWSYGLSNNQVAVPLLGLERINLSPTSIGLLFTITGITSVLVQGFFLGKLCRKIGEEKLAKIGLSLMALGLFLMAFSVSFFFLALPMMIMATGSAFSRPTLNSLISKLTPESQGVSFGGSMSFEATGRILGPLTGGFLFQISQGFGPFLVSAALIAAFLVFHRAIFKPAAVRQ